MIEADSEAFLVACQKTKKMAAIIIVIENPLPVVATVHDVVTSLVSPLLLARGA